MASEPKYLYHYAPPEAADGIARRGLLSTALQHGVQKYDPEGSGWRKYKQRAADAGFQKTRRGVLDWLDASLPDFRRSYAVSALSEPIPDSDDIHYGLKDLRDHSVLVRIRPAAELLAAGVVTDIWRTGVRGREAGRHVRGVASGRIRWADSGNGSGLSFSRIPHYMLQTSEGRIPPKYIEVLDKQDKKASEDSMDRLAADFASGPKWHDYDADREYAAHMAEFERDRTYKNLVDAAIIKRIRARIAENEARALLDRYDRETGASYKDILASRLAKFRSYERVPFPTQEKKASYALAIRRLRGED